MFYEGESWDIFSFWVAILDIWLDNFCLGFWAFRAAARSEIVLDCFPFFPPPTRLSPISRACVRRRRYYTVQSLRVPPLRSYVLLYRAGIV